MSFNSVLAGFSLISMGLLGFTGFLSISLVFF